MIRTLGGIAAGLASAIVLMMITEAIGNHLSPEPTAIALEGVGETPSVPLLNLLFPVIGWFLGALVGGWLSIRISDRPWTAWAVAAVVFVATLINFLFMAYPAWLIVVGLVVTPLGAWLAQKICAMAEAASE
jgi:MFS family permease